MAKATAVDYFQPYFQKLTQKILPFIEKKADEKGNLMTSDDVSKAINDLCVTVNGDIYPCSGWQSYIVGNIFKDSLKDIWDHSEKLNVIRNVKQKDFPKCLK